jgi:hypothetical protein
MALTLTLKDQILARPAEPSVVMRWADGVPMRLSDLIRERVVLEWERRNDEARFAGRPLVEIREVTDAHLPSLTGGARSRDPTLDEAITIAFEGFKRNAYFVLVDNRQILDLDAEIQVSPTADITFVRLLPLVGG